MARRKIEVIQEATNEKEFYSILDRNRDTLICAEIYCKFAGYCSAFDFLFHKMKLDWGSGEIIIIRVQADEIEALKRFHGHSEPVVMFILFKRVLSLLRGVNPILITNLAQQEIRMWRKYLKTRDVFSRKTYDLDEVTPSEEEWIACLNNERTIEMASLASKRSQRQASRKFHRAQTLVPHLQNLNFVLFWPHALHAHPELYELWGQNEIVMIAREEITFTKEKATDVFYQGDADILNEASLAFLMAGKALAICFRLLDNEKHFTTLMRQILYEDLQPIDEKSSAKDKLQLKTAFDKYKSYSMTKEEILRQRREAKFKQKEEESQKRAIRLAEMQRLAKEAIMEAKEDKKRKREQLKLELLKTGQLHELDKMKGEDGDDDVSIIIPEELPEELEFRSSEDESENENEQFPPAGLLIPGFYSPPNDIGKCNGLALLFPGIVKDYVQPPSEFLPNHVLVMLPIKQRHEAIKVLKKHKESVLYMGIFKAQTPYDAVHLAYTVVQFDALKPSLDILEEEIKLCIMVSTVKDTPVLKLMDLSPVHVSRDNTTGEDECAYLFNVGYGDDHPNLYEDFIEDELK